jgi:hypothetical protein
MGLFEASGYAFFSLHCQTHEHFFRRAMWFDQSNTNLKGAYEILL